MSIILTFQTPMLLHVIKFIVLFHFFSIFHCFSTSLFLLGQRLTVAQKLINIWTRLLDVRVNYDNRASSAKVVLNKPL